MTDSADGMLTLIALIHYHVPHIFKDFACYDGGERAPSGAGLQEVWLKWLTAECVDS